MTKQQKRERSTYGVRTFRSGTVIVAVSHVMAMRGAYGLPDDRAGTLYRVRYFRDDGTGYVAPLSEREEHAYSAAQAAERAFHWWDMRHPLEIEIGGAGGGGPKVREITAGWRFQDDLLDGFERTPVRYIDHLYARHARSSGSFAGFGEPWVPRVIHGDQPIPTGTIPHDQDARNAWADGFSRGARGQKPYFMDIDGHLIDITQAPKAYRDGYAYGRHLRITGNHAEIAEVWERMRRFAATRPPKPRKHRDMDKGYLVKNRGPVGSARGTIRHVGGLRMNTKALLQHYATEDVPAYVSSGSLWTDGIVLYSYGQPIAKKRVRADALNPGNLGRICEVDPRRFSPTTTRQQSGVRWAMERNGWRIEERNLGPKKW